MGDSVPGYRLGELLAEDGLVARYQAFEKDSRGFEHELRLTVFAIQSELDAEARAQFEADAAAAATLRSERIEAIEGHGYTESGRPVLRTALSVGKRLDTLLEEGPLPPPIALRLGADLAQALELAHGSGIVHGALRPSAVWVDDRGTAKVTDFGLGGVLGHMLGEETALLDASCRFHSPEQVRGEGPSEAGDRFSLASLLYETMTGKPAFEAPTALAITLKISMAKAPPLEGIPGLSAGARSLLGAMFAREASARPSGRDLTRALLDLGGREAEQRRWLTDRVAPPLPEDPDRLPFAAFAEVPEDATSLQIQLPNYVPEDVSIPLGDVLMPEHGDTTTPRRSRASAMSLDDLTERLEGDDETDGADADTAEHALPDARRRPVATLVLEGPADSGARWMDKTVQLPGGDPLAAPSGGRFAPPAGRPSSAVPPPRLPSRMPSTPPPPDAESMERAGPHPALIWAGIVAGAVAVMALVAVVTVLLAS